MDIIQTIKQTIEEILKKMTISVDKVDVVFDGEKKPKFLIQSKDAPLLIGHKGEHFSALNHIIKKILHKNTKENEEEFKFSIDINGYQEENLAMLKNKAKVVAERVRSFKTDIELDPMSSYERMEIHTFLENEPNIKTESRGEGKERRIVVKYVEDKLKV